MENMYYIGLDVHKKTISYCVKDGSGRIYAEAEIPTTRLDLDIWMKTLPQPWTAAMRSLDISSISPIPSRGSKFLSCCARRSFGRI